MVQLSPGAGKSSPCRDELCTAVDELRTLLEPTPEQLATSYLRVRQALSSLPPPAPSPSASRAPAQSSGPFTRRAGAGAEARAPRRRWAHWLASGGGVVAVAAAFALGRISAPGDAERDARPAAPAPPAAAAPALSSNDAGPARIEQGAEQDAVAAPDVGAEPAVEAPVVSSPSVPRSSDRSRATHRCCSQEDPMLRAECQLRRGQGRQALDSLRGAPRTAGHDRELVSALELLAKCQLGHDVRSLAERFFDEWPASPLAERIRNECPRAPSGVGARASGALGAPPALRITRAAPKF